MSEKNSTIDKNEQKEIENNEINDSVENDHETQPEVKHEEAQPEESNIESNLADKTTNDEAESPVLSEEDKLKLEVDVQKDKYLRLFAEFENYKRRTSKERIEMFKTAGQEVIQSLLPVLDDFDRAIKEVSKSQNDDAIKGVELIYSKLNDTLKAKGLEIFEVKEGDTFDADIHEAITQIPSPTPDLKGKIIDVVEKGYTLGDKIIRYPKVVTGK